MSISRVDAIRKATQPKKVSKAKRKNLEQSIDRGSSNSSLGFHPLISSYNEKVCPILDAIDKLRHLKVAQKIIPLPGMMSTLTLALKLPYRIRLMVEIEHEIFNKVLENGDDGFAVSCDDIDLNDFCSQFFGRYKQVLIDVKNGGTRVGNVMQTPFKAVEKAIVKWFG
ncbi:hypothetical protein Tco_0830689 [Tanacetum coccineum]